MERSRIVYYKSRSWLHSLVDCFNLRQNLDFLQHFWFEVLKVLVIGSYYCVNFWTFLPTFWFEALKVLAIGSYYCMNFCVFLHTFWFEVLKVLVIGSYWSRIPRRVLGYTCYTSWVQWWSKAMDFLETFFLDKYFLLPISEKHSSWSKIWWKSIASLHSLTQDM